jgi:flagellar motor switch protein FliM
MSEDQEQPESTEEEILSQESIESLVAQVAEEQSTVDVIGSSDKPNSKHSDDVKAYDFRQPSFLTSLELRKIRLRHEQFVESLAGRLSVTVRMEFGLKLKDMAIQSFEQSVPKLSQQSNFALFRVEPLRGISILEIPPRLASTIIDRLLGGPAHTVEAKSEFSEVEISLLEQAINVILVEWCNHWSSEHTHRPVILEHETSSQYLQTSPPDTLMLILTIEATLADCIDEIKLAIPYFTLEPLVRRLANLYSDDGTGPRQKSKAPPSWSERFDNVRVGLRTRCPGPQLTLQNLANLAEGDFLPLDSDFINQAELLVGDASKFKGRVGKINNHWAMEVQSRSPKEEVDTLRQ